MTERMSQSRRCIWKGLFQAYNRYVKESETKTDSFRDISFKALEAKFYNKLEAYKFRTDILTTEGITLASRYLEDLILYCIMLKIKLDYGET